MAPQFYLVSVVPLIHQTLIGAAGKAYVVEAEEGEEASPTSKKAVFTTATEVT